jgi:hypothetical protein
MEIEADDSVKPNQASSGHEHGKQQRTMPTIALANLRVREDHCELVHEVCGQRCRTTYHVFDARKIILFGCRMLVSLDYYSQRWPPELTLQSITI